MHRRLERYNVEFWAEEFLGQLHGTRTENGSTTPTLAMEHCAELISEMYRQAERRILFLDYDGTLVGFKTLPEQAKPDDALIRQLQALAADSCNTVVLISGRDRGILGEWFGDIRELTLVASHGLWLRRPGERWVMTASLDNEWKDAVRPILQCYSDRMPGSFIEEKEFALALHYRGCDPDMARNKVNELRQTLNSMIKSSTLMIQEGSKVLELRDSRFNKGSAATLLTKQDRFDFFLGAGDDVTDEDLFRALPPKAVTVKVGAGETAARCRVKSWQSLRELLAVLTHPDRGR
jgi:trehalose 6-phosphate synthase/phosphatase